MQHAEDRPHVPLGVVAHQVEDAERIGRLAHRRREENVVAREEAGDDPAGPVDHPDGARVVGGACRVSLRSTRPGETLDVAGRELAAEGAGPGLEGSADISTDDDEGCDLEGIHRDYGLSTSGFQHDFIF